MNIKSKLFLAALSLMIAFSESAVAQERHCCVCKDANGRAVEILSLVGNEANCDEICSAAGDYWTPRSETQLCELSDWCLIWDLSNLRCLQCQFGYTRDGIDGKNCVPVDR